MQPNRDTDTPKSFSLLILIKRGNISGGGLPNLVHVATVVNGATENQTEDLPYPYVWNQFIKLSFPSLESNPPTIISFFVYKKRWTSPGFKLVGSIQVPLSDFLLIKNKGPKEHEVNILQNRKNFTLHGSLVISFELRDHHFDLTEMMHPSPRPSLSGEHQQHDLLTLLQSSAAVPATATNKKRRSLSSPLPSASNTASASASTSSTSSLQRPPSNMQLFLARLWQEICDDCGDWCSYGQEHFYSLLLRSLQAGCLLLLVFFAYYNLQLSLAVQRQTDGLFHRLEDLVTQILSL